MLGEIIVSSSFSLDINKESISATKLNIKGDMDLDEDITISHITTPSIDVHGPIMRS
jgi:hypothetical protein